MDGRNHTRVCRGAADRVGIRIGIVSSLKHEISGRFRSSGLYDRSMFRQPKLYELYMRIGSRVFQSCVYRRALTLASVTVEQAARRKGVFTAMVGRSQPSRLSEIPSFVENIMNPVVKYVLEQRRLTGRRTSSQSGSASAQVKRK